MPQSLHHLPKDDSRRLQLLLRQVNWSSIWSMVPARVKRSYNTFPKLQPSGFLVPELLCHQHFLSSGRLGDMNIRLPLSIAEGVVAVITFPPESSVIMMVWD